MKFKPQLNNRRYLFLFITLAIVALLILKQNGVIFSANEFSIQFKEDKNHVELICQNGCDWNTLKVSTQEDKTVFIDNNGLYLNKKSASDSDFLFKIKALTNGFQLTGLKGTQWQHIDFKFIQTRQKTIDEEGFVDTPSE